MKKFLICVTLLITLAGCDHNKWLYHSQLEGHDILVIQDQYNQRHVTLIHDPDCMKCKQHPDSTIIFSDKISPD